MDADKNRAPETLLTEADIRSLVRLMGDVSCLDLDLAQKRQLILHGLAQLIQSSGWAWSLTEQAGKRTIRLDAMSGGDKLLLPPSAQALDRPPPAKPLARHRAKVRTRKKARATSIELFQQARTLSLCELSGDTASRLVFARPIDSPAFTAREEEMVRIVAEELGWLHELNPACISLQPEVHLSPREREICALLAEGLSSKAIAERLHISSHTVHDYIKAIYRTFGIRSRAEAIKQLTLVQPQD